MWLIIGFGLLLLLILWLTTATNTTNTTNTNTTSEGFLTVDPETLAAQRQLLQFEGERRYNTFARAQSPLNNIAAADVQAAFQMSSPTATSMTDSLLTMLGTSGRLGAADDQSGKQGAQFEQTGMVQSKINFCESLAVNCSLLDDPRAAECGMCHRDGLDSKGKAHRGGLYISSDDQIRANQAAVSAGGKAQYQPTIGSCAPQNFTLLSENCTAREMQMQCQSSSALGGSCAQCFGAAPASATGLLYVGPTPRAYSAILWLSHPGGHSNNGAGTTVTYSNGFTVSSPPSNNPLLAPTQIPLTITEGDTITISVVGIPVVWCAWLSSPDGNRTVSVDIGEQSITPTDGLMIIGDKRAPQIAAAVAALDTTNVWPAFQNQIPNSVMMYGRRPDIIPPMILSAAYGPSQNNTVDVSDYVKQIAGSGKDLVIQPNVIPVAGPIPGAQNYLWITVDKGAAVIAADSQTLLGATLNNTMQMLFQVPATLIDPIFEEDKADCPTGPLVTTAIGAGLMGSHSCYNPDGTFNPSVFCLQELFGAAGGTEAGTGWPTAAGAPWVQNDPTTGKPSLDLTTTFLNNQAQIALYGIDLNNVGVDYPTLQAASQFIMGRDPANPCDTVNASSGPHSTECLNYLWTQSGCTPAGQGAPVDGNGNVNQNNVTSVAKAGSVLGIQAYYNEIYGNAQGTLSQNDYDLQDAASLLCFNTSVKQKVVLGSNPPEVFQVQSPLGTYAIAQADAVANCAIFSAQVASTAQLQQANLMGAEWCSTGWVSDDPNPKFPITSLAGIAGCGSGSPGISTWNPGGVANANCYGVKPVAGTENVAPFNSQQWSANILPGQAYAATTPSSSVPNL